MGFFGPRFTDEDVLCFSFQMIAVAIDVGAHTGIVRASGMEAPDLCALYFWMLGSLEDSPEKVNRMRLRVLADRPGNPMKPNLTDCFNYSSGARFEIPTNEQANFALTIAALTSSFTEKYLEVRNIDDSTWFKQCATDAERILGIHLADRYSKSNQGILAILALALRSILKESQKLGSKDRRKIRESGIFWLSMLVTTWCFKN